MKLVRSIQSLFLGLTLLAAPAAIAATNPTGPGTTSVGEIVVSLEVTAQAWVYGLTDFTFGQVDPQGTEDLVGENTSVCVYAQGSGGANLYTVTVESFYGSGTVFALGDGGTETIPYTVDWSDGSTSQTLQQAVDSNQFNASSTTDCASSGVEATMTVTIQRSEVATAVAGAYDDTLTITINPI